MIRLSRSEAEAMAVKAARGAGLAWGLAEEAGFAVRWLVDQGIDGLALMAAYLDLVSARPKPNAALVLADGVWFSHDPQPLCPIALGAALSDHFDLPDGPVQRRIKLTNVASPALVLPFLAQAGERAGVVVIAEWALTRVILADRMILALSGAPYLAAAATHNVSVTVRPKPPAPTSHPPEATVSGDPVSTAAGSTAAGSAGTGSTAKVSAGTSSTTPLSTATSEILNRLMLATYVQASDQSRLGAGVACGGGPDR